MTKQKILDKALILFSLKGYDAASMDMLAKEVGIKKASIYAHFESKEIIFTKLFNMTLTDYSEFLNNSVNINSPNIEDELYKIFYEYVNYFKNEKIKMKFWERLYLFPPDFLKKIIYKKTYDIEFNFMKKLNTLFLNGIKLNIFKKSNSWNIVTAFYSLMSGFAMGVYFYENTNIDKGIKSCMEIFLKGIILK